MLSTAQESLNLGEYAPINTEIQQRQRLTDDWRQLTSVLADPDRRAAPIELNLYKGDQHNPYGRGMMKVRITPLSGGANLNHPEGLHACRLELARGFMLEHFYSLEGDEGRPRLHSWTELVTADGLLTLQRPELVVKGEHLYGIDPYIEAAQDAELNGEEMAARVSTAYASTHLAAA